MILAALRAKLREKGITETACDAAATVSAVIWWSSLYGVLAGLLVGVAIPIVAFELVVAALPGGCRCVNSHDECRCGRGDR